MRANNAIADRKGDRARTHQLGDDRNTSCAPPGGALARGQLRHADGHQTIASVLLAVAALCGCAAPLDRPTPDVDNINKDATDELRRICSLPEPDRQAEIDRVKTEHGMVLYCPKKP